MSHPDAAAGQGPRPVATIASVQLTPTHDGEAALVVELVYPNGSHARVQIDSRSTAGIMARANARQLGELVGLPWTMLLE